MEMKWNEMNEWLIHLPSDYSLTHSLIFPHDAFVSHLKLVPGFRACFCREIVLNQNCISFFQETDLCEPFGPDTTLYKQHKTGTIILYYKTTIYCICYRYLSLNQTSKSQTLYLHSCWIQALMTAKKIDVYYNLYSVSVPDLTSFTIDFPGIKD